MDTSALWTALTTLLGKVLDLVKPLVAALLVQRATNIETEKDVLEEANDIKKKQLDIANAPDRQPSGIRNSMQSGDF